MLKGDRKPWILPYYTGTIFTHTQLPASCSNQIAAETPAMSLWLRSMLKTLIKAFVLVPCDCLPFSPHDN